MPPFQRDDRPGHAAVSAMPHLIEWVTAQPFVALIWGGALLFVGVLGNQSL